MRNSPVHCTHCGAQAGEYCVSSEGIEYRTGWTHRARRDRTKAYFRCAISAAEITTERMLAGNDKKYSTVVVNGRVHTWHGNHWRTGAVAGEDEELLPRVIEPTPTVLQFGNTKVRLP